MGAENRNPYLRLFNSLRSFIGECVHNSTTFQKELLKIPNILSLIILTKYMWDTENYIQLFKITIAPGRRAKNDNAITKRHLLIDFFLSHLASHLFFSSYPGQDFFTDICWKFVFSNSIFQTLLRISTGLPQTSKLYHFPRSVWTVAKRFNISSPISIIMSFFQTPLT